MLSIWSGSGHPKTPLHAIRYDRVDLFAGRLSILGAPMWELDRMLMIPIVKGRNVSSDESKTELSNKNSRYAPLCVTFSEVKKTPHNPPCTRPFLTALHVLAEADDLVLPAIALNRNIIVAAAGVVEFLFGLVGLRGEYFSPRSRMRLTGVGRTKWLVRPVSSSSSIRWRDRDYGGN